MKFKPSAINLWSLEKTKLIRLISGYHRLLITICQTLLWNVNTHTYPPPTLPTLSPRQSSPWMNALTSLMRLLSKGAAAFVMARGETHYHGIAGHEAAEAAFSCWENHSCPPALPSNSVNMNQGKAGSTHLPVHICSCNHEGLDEVGTLVSSQQAKWASELAEIANLGSCKNCNPVLSTAAAPNRDSLWAMFMPLFQSVCPFQF